MRQSKHNKLAPPTIQSLLSWRRKRVQWSQQVMVHRLSPETLPTSKLFQSTLHRAKRMVLRKMTERPQEYSKTHLRPKKRVCRDDPKDMSNLLPDFQAMYKSFMTNRLEQGTFLIHLFILRKSTFFFKKEISVEHLLSNFDYRTVNIGVVVT